MRQHVYWQRRTNMIRTRSNPTQRLILGWRSRKDKYKLCLTAFKCLREMAPPYISELCVPVAQIEGRRQLRSAARGQLVVPRIKLMTYANRAFAWAGSSAWNSIPDWLKGTSLSFGTFKSSLKTFLFLEYGTSKHYRNNLWYRAIAN